MKKLFAIVVLMFAMMFAPAAFAQHQGHGNSHATSHPTQHAQIHENVNVHVNIHSFGANHRTHFGRQQLVIVGGRGCYRYNGLYFYAGFWPDWFFMDDVYFVLAPDGLWYAHSYVHPGLFFQVYI